MGVDDWHEVSRKKHGYRTKEDDVVKISTSIYVSNFPESTTAKDLFASCKVYGHVVDSFIPNKRAKNGKRFAFIRFINVFSVERLVSNLCTVWIGKHRLQANFARYQRTSDNGYASEVKSKSSFRDYKEKGSGRNNVGKMNNVFSDKGGLSYVKVVQDHASFTPSAPALVLDDACVVTRDLSRHVMGKVKDINVIPNLRSILSKEGFPQVNISYLGGFWVMIEMDNVTSKTSLLDHVGVNSWFHSLKEAWHDFVSDDRVVWVDIEGIPLHVWSRETYLKVGNKWGKALDIEDNSGLSFARKRLCVLTKQPDTILENFKVTFKGKVYKARAKELFTWDPIIVEPKESNYISDDDSVQGDINQPEGLILEDDSDVAEVSETVFGDNSASHQVPCGKTTKDHSEDPFGIYDLLNKRVPDGFRDVSPSLSHPPGFTPLSSDVRKDENLVEDAAAKVADKESSISFNAKVMNVNQEIPVSSNEGADSFHPKSIHSGGSILGLMEDMIRVGNSMGYKMEGCLGHKTKKEWVKELNTKHKINFLAIQETKMDRVSHMDVKFMWGHSNYDFVSSDSVGNSGGILCIWEASIFKKDYATVSDNFIAIYGTWLPNNAKILFVAVYAPQSPSCKRTLWEYISILIGRWKGEAIVMGDFNEVRSINERLGSVFNESSARSFDHFISSSGLVDVNLEGYSFTWAHSSASKMSKLDRFLLLITSFPHPIIILSDSDVEDTFSSTHSPDYIPASPDYFPASPGNTSSNFLDDLTKDLLASLALSPFYDDPYMKVVQAYDATDNELPIPPQALIAPPTILPPSLVLSLSRLF
ncbi:RNA-directed DNA polymerase, eukaryota [Tanacetum coccineum]